MKIGWKGKQTKEANETSALGIEFSKFLEGGDVISLVGQLATGKTTFIKGVLAGLGYKESVTSPTFTLVNEYLTKFTIIHIDCYREENLDRWIQIGLHDYFNDENIVFIEWADKIIDILPKDTISIKFSHLGNNNRKIELDI
tara:strand:+ start:56 stop:481 length:426 start_codon:yes stop_codon:yes gene_type:complete